MQLTKLNDETLKRYYLAWIGLDSERRKKMESKLKKQLMRDKSLQDPFALIHSNRYGESIRKVCAFHRRIIMLGAVKRGNWHLSIRDLVTDEAMDAFVQEMVVGSPPWLDKESIIIEMKRSH